MQDASLFLLRRRPASQAERQRLSHLRSGRTRKTARRKHNMPAKTQTRPGRRTTVLKVSTRPARVIPCPRRALAPADRRWTARSHAQLDIATDLRFHEPTLLPKLAVYCALGPHPGPCCIGHLGNPSTHKALTTSTKQRHVTAPSTQNLARWSTAEDGVCAPHGRPGWSRS